MSKVHSTKTCSFEGCGRQHHAYNLCKAHYFQRRTGAELHPIHSTQRPAGTPPRILYDEATCQNPNLIGPCHVFRGSKGHHGHCRVLVCGKLIYVHRYIWERDVGLIPEGMVIDHQCRNPACCNVNHLRVVTVKVNATENVVGCCWQLLSARTHCPQGHPFDEENTFWRADGGRRCKACHKKWKESYNQK